MNSMMDFYLASGDIFVSCVASNPFHKQEISVFDVAYNHSFDMEYFYFCTVFLAAMLGPLILKNR